MSWGLLFQHLLRLMRSIFRYISIKVDNELHICRLFQNLTNLNILAAGRCQSGVDTGHPLQGLSRRGMVSACYVKVFLYGTHPLIVCLNFSGVPLYSVLGSKKLCWWPYSVSSLWFGEGISFQKCWIHSSLGVLEWRKLARWMCVSSNLIWQYTMCT